MSKIHVILSEGLLENKPELEDIVKKIVDAGDIQDVNDKRLYKYGILSGNIENKSKIKLIEELEEVKSVKLDEIRRALK